MSLEAKILMIYTGGTIGCVPSDPQDPTSPLIPAKNIQGILETIPGYHKEFNGFIIDGNKAFIHTIDWEHPIDSADVDPGFWIRLAEIIKKNYNSYDGFVVLHGTDTMAYSSSALSFLLENLSKPVIITGSQRPLYRSRSDAIQNLVTAIEFAASKNFYDQPLPEVCILFRNNLLRGNRSSKISASNFDAFSSPNYPPLAQAQTTIVYNHARIRPSDGRHLKVYTKMETGIAAIDIFPGMSPSLLNSFLMTPNLRGVVLRTYGAGNAPTSKDFLSVIAQAVSRGIVVVDVTQCWSGEVDMGLYDTSVGLLSAGVVSGLDMTSAAALTKLAVLLGKEEEGEVVSDLMQINLRGEQSKSIFHLHFSEEQCEAEDTRILSSGAKMIGARYFNPDHLEKVQLRIYGLECDEDNKIEFYLNLPDPSSVQNSDKEFHLIASLHIHQEKPKPYIMIPVKKSYLQKIDYREEQVLTIACTKKSHWQTIDLVIFQD